MPAPAPRALQASANDALSPARAAGDHDHASSALAPPARDPDATARVALTPAGLADDMLERSARGVAAELRRVREAQRCPAGTCFCCDDVRASDAALDELERVVGALRAAIAARRCGRRVGHPAEFTNDRGDAK